MQRKFLGLSVAVSVFLGGLLLLLAMVGPARLLAGYDVQAQEVQERSVHGPDVHAQAITVGNVYTRTVSTASFITLNVTTGAGADRLLLVGVGSQAFMQTPKREITSIKFGYGGTELALTNVISRENGAGKLAAIYQLVGPPPGTSGTVTVTYNQSVSYGIVVGAANFEGVDQATPIAAAASAAMTSTTAIVTVTTTANDLVFDTVGLFMPNPVMPITPTTGQTQLWNERWGTANVRVRGGASTRLASGSETVMSWAMPGSRSWAICAVAIQPALAAQVQVTLLHTNDFHGYLEGYTTGRGGSAYIAGQVNEIRAAVGAENVALLDAGDVYFGGGAISSLTLGESAIDIYNRMGYQVAAYGNHEFDRGQTVLAERTAQSQFAWVSANIVLEGTEWDHPAWCEPYEILGLGSGSNLVTLGVIGLTTDETPVATPPGMATGLVFKDPTAAVLHYYDEVKTLSDAVIVLAHIGTYDSGPYKGLMTIAQELIDAGKPVDLMIGGHLHEQLGTPIMIGGTSIVEAGYNGRVLGQVTATIERATKKLTVDAYGLIAIYDTLPPDAAIADRVAYWHDVVAPLMAEPVGTTNVSLVRDYNGESNVGNLVADSMLWKADEYDDGEVNGSVQVAFTNAGGLRTDIIIPPEATLPYTITWGQTNDLVPFANTLYLMDLSGYQIQKLLDQSATLYKGHLQVSGISFYYYNDTGTASPTAWGAYGVKVGGEDLDYQRTYRIVTNSFLAPGGDGFVTFAEGTSREDTFYDMQQALNDYIAMYNTTAGPIDHAVEGRIQKLDKVVTILHTNDEHGRAMAELAGGSTPQGLGYLASLVKAERAKNPGVLLFTAGDSVQGTAFAYYFRNAPGETPGGTTALSNPIIATFNALGYNAGTFGNHEFNFGSASFANYQNQPAYTLLAANLHDDGSYGVDYSRVKEYTTFDVAGLKVGVMGMTNPRVPSYELPGNIVGLTFEDGLDAATRVVPLVQAENPDLVVAISHLGYVPYEGSTAEDTDVYLAENLAGIDVIIGGHSHTTLDPAVMVTSITNTNGTLIAQARRLSGQGEHRIRGQRWRRL